MKKAVILIAHGSRRQQTAQEMDLLSEQLQKETPDRLICSAYMELQKPTLKESIESAASQGIRDIEILPLFFFTGKHMIEDIPQQVQECRNEYKDCSIVLLPCIGKSPEFIKALKNSI